MACCIIEEFPFLKDDEGLGYVRKVANILSTIYNIYKLSCCIAYTNSYCISDTIWTRMLYDFPEKIFNFIAAPAGIFTACLSIELSLLYALVQNCL